MRNRSDVTEFMSRLAIVSMCAMIVVSAVCSARLDAAEMSAKRPAMDRKQGHVRFGDLYVAGMATLLPGGGTLEVPGGKTRVSAEKLRSDLLIPSGSLITTGAKETARIRLGERSMLRVNPNSALRIYSLHLELERGQLCVQHGKTTLPLLIQAASSSFILDRESAADVFLSGSGNMIVTIQAGTARIQGAGESFVAGQRIEVKNGAVVTDPHVAELAEWAAYSLVSGIQEFTPRLGLEFEVVDPDIRPVTAPAGHGVGDGVPTTQPEADSSPSKKPAQKPDETLEEHDLGGYGRP